MPDSGHGSAIRICGMIIWAAVVTARVFCMAGPACERRHNDCLSSPVFAGLWRVVKMRDCDNDLIRNDMLRSLFLWKVPGFCVGMPLLAVCLPKEKKLGWYWKKVR